MTEDERDAGCRCGGCGERYRVDIILSDDLWRKLQEALPAGPINLLCGSCIIERLERFGEFAAFKLEPL